MIHITTNLKQTNNNNNNKKTEVAILNKTKKTSVGKKTIRHK